jgi:acyl dehydratase
MIGEKLVYFAGIDKARFRKPVYPGDQIDLPAGTAQAQTHDDGDERLRPSSTTRWSPKLN